MELKLQQQKHYNLNGSSAGKFIYTGLLKRQMRC